MYRLVIRAEVEHRPQTLKEGTDEVSELRSILLQGGFALQDQHRYLGRGIIGSHLHKPKLLVQLLGLGIVSKHVYDQLLYTNCASQQKNQDDQTDGSRGVPHLRKYCKADDFSTLL